MLPLPAVEYEYAEWKRCRVGLDYHVEIARHDYSVPYQLLRQEVEARITTATVEIFHRGKRVASHVRCHRPHRPSTIAEHMPSSRFVGLRGPHTPQGGATATGRTTGFAARRPGSVPTPPPRSRSRSASIG